MAKTTKRTQEAPRADVYERITAQIVAALEAGTRPWLKPWAGNGIPTRPLRQNGIPYRGINTVLLWMETAAKGYGSPFWLTYKQAAAMGAHVRKGEKSALVVYAGAIERTEQAESGEDIERRIPFMKGYSVFNAEQIEGLPAHYHSAVAARSSLSDADRLPQVDAFFAATGADIRESTRGAFYSPTEDFIGMPPFGAFVSAEAHAATLGHECIHWTRHATRLNRDFGRKAWGDEGYAREELAELGSAYLAADLGLAIEPREDHAAYIASWIEVLKNDKRTIFQAASYAEKAVAFLHGLQPGATASDPEEIDAQQIAA
jgi:antirestriction protein ArdC